MIDAIPTMLPRAWRHRARRRAWACVLLACAGISPSRPAIAEGSAQEQPPAIAQKDRYLVRIPTADQGGEGARDAALPAQESNRALGFSGRLIFFFVPDEPRWQGVEPADGPFLGRPLPVASVAVRALDEGGAMAVDADPLAASERDGAGIAALAELEGAWRVQAVLDADFTVPGHLGPGNLVSDVVAVDLSRGRSDEIAFTLSRRLPPRAEAGGGEIVEGVEGVEGVESVEGVERFARPSPLLSAAWRRPMSIRASVVLPYGYDDLSYPRRIWPTIFVLGDLGSNGPSLNGLRLNDLGSNDLEAMAMAPALRDPRARAAVPQAVWVFLDAATPWGFGGFCDSDANGPMARALVEEFIPALEERFRVISRADARVLLGHGLGGWSALHLLLSKPEVFGACYASSPDFVDFSAIGRVDLYRDPNLFTTRDGTATPAVRSILGPDDDRIHLLLREQLALEHAVDPNGRSGQRWAARDAMWSPWQAERNAPRPICNPETGEVDVVAAESWSRLDVARRLEREPARVGPLLAERAHILVSARDPLYRNDAVARLKAKLEAWRAREQAAGRSASTRGTIEIVDDMDDDALRQLAVLRFHREIAAALRSSGHADAIPTGEQTLDGDGPRPAPSPRPPSR